MPRPKKAQPKSDLRAVPRRRDKRGPASDDYVAKTIGTLSQSWRDDAEATLVALQSELRRRVADLDALELIGAIRALSEAVTTHRALLPEPVAEEKPEEVKAA